MSAPNPVGPVADRLNDMIAQALALFVETFSTVGSTRLVGQSDVIVSFARLDNEWTFVLNIGNQTVHWEDATLRTRNALARTLGELWSACEAAQSGARADTMQALEAAQRFVASKVR